MIRLTLAALAVTIALPALANGDWPDKPEQPVKEEPKPDPKPEPEPPAPEPETPEPEPETPTPEPEPEQPGCPDCENPPPPQLPEPEQPETPEPPGCPDCENPPNPQPEPEQPTEPEQPAEPRDRFTPQASDRETRFARAEPCCTKDGTTYAKRTLFGIGQGKAVEYCAKVDPAKIPACDVKVMK